MILVAEDVGEHRKALAFQDQSMAMPAIGRVIGTPASISASEVPHTVAIEEDPLDSVISETMRSV